MQPPPPFSRHAGFFASLHRVEHRLASEQRQEEEEERPFSDTMTASPLLFLDPAPPAAADLDSSGPALDLLTLTKQEPPQVVDDDDEDIARLMALLGLSPPRDVLHGDSGSGGCDCSGADGFLAKVVGVVGPKCDREHRRLDAWIHHYHRRSSCREPARLAHLLLAKASGDTAAAFPATVKGFLDRDAPPQEDHVMSGASSSSPA